MPKPQANPTALRRILQQELLLGKRMIEIAEAQSEAIPRRDMARLSQLELEMRQISDQMEGLESLRIAATRALAFALGMETVPPLTTLLPKLPIRDQQALAQIRTQILETQSRLDTLSTRNKILLESALDFVQFSLQVLTEAAFQPARYGTNPASIVPPTLYIDSKV
jgi:flagellar biosynthesis/type III secretory pathway chaperone